jgi:hypothetical protein
MFFHYVADRRDHYVNLARVTRAEFPLNEGEAQAVKLYFGAECVTLDLPTQKASDLRKLLEQMRRE